MKEYKNVRSTIYPQKQMSKTKVRIPSNIKKNKTKDEFGNEYVEYIYNETVYEMSEFMKINDDDIQNNFDVTMMAIDYSYMETSEMLDIIMMAIDALYCDLTSIISKL